MIREDDTVNDTVNDTVKTGNTAARPFGTLAEQSGARKGEGSLWELLGRTDILPAGHQLNKPSLLFSKIEDEVIQAQQEKLERIIKENEAANYKAEPIKETIGFDDFQKLDIRVGTVLECERVPKMKKLLKFKIADGLKDRVIVSGISQWYEPEQLIGKQVLFVANLAPREFKNGLVSEGMILSAENYDGTISVTTTLSEVKPGSKIS